MSLLDGHGSVGNWGLKAIVIMIHPTGRQLKFFLKTYFLCPEKSLNIDK